MKIAATLGKTTNKNKHPITTRRIGKLELEAFGARCGLTSGTFGAAGIGGTGTGTVGGN
jgi:hypothetical protein